MIIIRQDFLDQARMWLSTHESYARVGGKINWGRGEEPVWVEYLTGWPVLALRLVSDTRRARVQTAMQIRKSSWHAHLPRERLGIPAQFRVDAPASRRCLRREGDSYIFDFTGMSPLPPGDDLLRTAAVLLDEIQNFQRYHPEVLDRLGIEISVRLRDEAE